MAEEYIECIRAGFFTYNTGKRSYQNIINCGYIEDYKHQECSVIVRNHRSDNIIRFSLIWWKNYHTGLKRDQLTFKHSLQLAGISQQYLGVSDPRQNNKYFRHRLVHIKSIRLLQRIVRKYNQITELFVKIENINNYENNEISINGGKIIINNK